MTRLLLAAIVASVTLQPRAGDLVELDIAVVDRDGTPVTGLLSTDFQIKEDGKPVDIKTFTAVAADGLSPDSARQLVLLLDDTLPIAGTAIVQKIAQAVLLRARRDDEITVVRLHNEHDEPFGDLDTALARIGGYRAAAIPLQRRDAADRVFKVLTAVSKHLEAVDHRRKVFVCIGGPNVCNALEPQPQGYSPLWPGWVTAISATSRANVAIYAIMPVFPGSIANVAHGLVEFTGGNAFFNTTKFDAFVDGMWREASQYYLAGYWPAASTRELHDVSVKVARKGLHVRARLRRG
jgi:VWFA-related protein